MATKLETTGDKKGKATKQGSKGGKKLLGLPKEDEDKKAKKGKGASFAKKKGGKKKGKDGKSALGKSKADGDSSLGDDFDDVRGDISSSSSDSDEDQKLDIVQEEDPAGVISPPAEPKAEDKDGSVS